MTRHFAILSILLAGVLVATAQSLTTEIRNAKGRDIVDYFESGLSHAAAQSAFEQKQKDLAEQGRVKQKDTIDALETQKREKEIKVEAGQYSATMRHQEFIDRVTARVPSPNLVSNTLRQIGPVEVSCQTNRRSGTIDYRVGCQATNREAIFSFLKGVPSRTSISQGTNSVSFAIRLPVAQ